VVTLPETSWLDGGLSTAALVRPHIELFRSPNHQSTINIYKLIATHVASPALIGQLVLTTLITDHRAPRSATFRSTILQSTLQRVSSPALPTQRRNAPGYLRALTRVNFPSRLSISLTSTHHGKPDDFPFLCPSPIRKRRSLLSRGPKLGSVQVLLPTRGPTSSLSIVLSRKNDKDAQVWKVKIDGARAPFAALKMARDHLATAGGG